MIELISNKWDSEFFGFPVGTIHLPTGFLESELISLLESAEKKYRLLYIIAESDITNGLGEYAACYSYIDERIVFEKSNIKTQDIKSSHVFEYTNKEQVESLYELAYVGGSFSRFKLDIHFSENIFKSLYRKMIENSIKGEYADKIFIYKTDKIEGLITASVNKSLVKIGLIGVDPAAQGKGIGAMLMDRIEEYALETGSKRISVLTQGANIRAAQFYKKKGYQIADKKYLFHLWFS